MVTEFYINAVPTEESTQGYMKIKEYGQNMDLHFMMDKDFRGKLTTVTWNLPDDVKHVITEQDEPEQWAMFAQVGERPEIVVSSTWLDTMKLPKTAQLRIKFTFDTFRFNPEWYAYLYVKQAYGDLNPPYKAPKSVDVDPSDSESNEP